MQSDKTIATSVSALPSTSTFTSTSTSTSTSTDPISSTSISTDTTSFDSTSSTSTSTSTSTDTSTDTSSTPAPAPVPLDADGKPLSKRQQKKLRRYEHTKAERGVKRKQQRDRTRQHRKQERQERLAKRQKLVEAGDEAALQAFDASFQRTFELMQRRGSRRRAEVRELMLSAPTITWDCSYQSLMNDKELQSLNKQVHHAYAQNTRADKPLKMELTSVKEGDTLYKMLNKSKGFHDWAIERSPSHYLDIHDRSKIIYLTAESDTVLNELKSDYAYIIGGLVDHNRHKGHVHNHVTKSNIATARLPIQEYMINTRAMRTVITCNQVFEILLDFYQHGSWVTAFKKALPPRWEWSSSGPTTLTPQQLAAQKQVDQSESKEVEEEEEEDQEEVEQEQEQEQERPDAPSTSSNTFTDTLTSSTSAASASSPSITDTFTSISTSTSTDTSTCTASSATSTPISSLSAALDMT